MDNRIYPEFDLAFQTSRVPRENGRGTSTCIKLALVHLATGREHRQEFDHGFPDISKAVEDLILTHFPTSKAAAGLRNYRGLVPCTLIGDWHQNIGELIHVALRKICDSRPTSFWYNVIHALPAPLWNMMCQRGVTQLAVVQKDGKATARKFGLALKKAWTQTLDEGQWIRVDNGSARVNYDLAEKGWPPLADELTLKQLEEVRDKAKLAYLALNYLEEADWRNMLGFALTYATGDHKVTLHRVETGSASPFVTHPQLGTIWAAPLQSHLEADTLADLQKADDPAQNHIFTLQVGEGAVVGITGFYNIADNTWGLRWHGVIPPFRGLGYSKKAFDLVVTQLKEYQLDAKELVEYVEMASPDAPQLLQHFEKLGFVAQGQPADATTFSKSAALPHVSGLWQSLVYSLKA